jgi:ubiquinone/menaquinone biosynthesis C-methylase UbiE
MCSGFPVRGTEFHKMIGAVLEPDTDLADTGERMIPEHHSGHLLYAEHLIRYECIRELVAGKSVLDIATGSGYGAAILAERASHVHGMDKDPQAVAYAHAKFAARNVTFTIADAERIPLPDNSVDVVVTFETIEHVEDYVKFVEEIRRVLKPDGIAIVSTPNDAEFAEGNHFHLHQFKREELLELLGRYFPDIEEYYQATWKYVALDRLTALQERSPKLQTINVAPLSVEQSLYFYFLCSARPIHEKVIAMGAMGAHYSDRDLIAHHNDTSGQLESLRLQVDAQTRELGQLESLRLQVDAQTRELGQLESLRLQVDAQTRELGQLESLRLQVDAQTRATNQLKSTRTFRLALVFSQIAAFLRRR